MRFKTLPEWLQWQEQLHFTNVDPGLTRIGQVWQLLGRESVLPFTVVTVAGTNGKGSSVAMLSSILCEAGYRVGTYTSPHLLEYNERICINTIPCDDELICQSFERIDRARDTISLTYFEFSTLAAVDIFCQQNIDIAILEVGMGGRLDATNLFDCDIALITPIGLDHTAWLGTDIEQIGREKAGIIRSEKPVVCSQPVPPKSVINYAKKCQSPISLAGRDFNFDMGTNDWRWHNKTSNREQLALPALVGSYQIQNASAVLQVIDLLISEYNYSLSNQQISSGLKHTKLAGRFQQIDGDIKQIFDVTHNEQGAQNLAKLLQEIPCKGRTVAVLAMLNDKDPVTVVDELKDVIDDWYVAGLEGNRGMAAETLATLLKESIPSLQVIQKERVVDAYQAALNNAIKGDRVLILGSFLTVEAVLKFLNLEIK